MKKKILATIMTLTLGAAMLTACGSSSDETVDTNVNESVVSEAETTPVETTVPATEAQDNADVETTETATDVETTEAATDAEATDVETTEAATEIGRAHV